jgi:hypothetical protein
MSTATTALAGTLAVFFTGLGTAKIRAVPAMRQRAAHVGMSTAYRRIGALEVAGAAGVLVGLAQPRIGALAGRLCPNTRLDDGRRFDEVAAGRFAVVTSTDPSAAQRAQVDHRGGVLVATGPSSELDWWLCRGRSTAAIVRPDATVVRAGRDLSALCAALPASSARRATPVSTFR